MPPALVLQLKLLLQIPLCSFSVVVEDKDGTDKEHKVSLVNPMTLFNLSEAFPLRKRRWSYKLKWAKSVTPYL